MVVVSFEGQPLNLFQQRRLHSLKSLILSSQGASLVGLVNGRDAANNGGGDENSLQEVHGDNRNPDRCEDAGPANRLRRDPWFDFVNGKTA